VWHARTGAPLGGAAGTRGLGVPPGGRPREPAELAAVLFALNLQAGEAPAGAGGAAGPGGCALRHWESGGLRAAFAGHPGAPVLGMAAAGRAMGVDALDALLQDVLGAFVERFGERLSAAGGGSRAFKGTRSLVWSAYRRALGRAAARVLAHGVAGGWLFFARNEPEDGPPGGHAGGSAARLRGSYKASPVVPASSEAGVGLSGPRARVGGRGICCCFGGGRELAEGPTLHFFREGSEEGQAVDSLLLGRHQSRQDAQLARAVLHALQAFGGPPPACQAPGPEGAAALDLAWQGRRLPLLAVRLPRGVAALPLGPGPAAAAATAARPDLAALDALAALLAASGELPSPR